jgi:hypothetical protein
MKSVISDRPVISIVRVQIIEENIERRWMYLSRMRCKGWGIGIV